ncbi:hypothetical protein LINPERHAP1_LOCUS32890 [Linum perenne]
MARARASGIDLPINFQIGLKVGVMEILH